MAKDTNRVLEGTIDAFKRLKEEVKAYKDELATLKVGTEEWNKTARKLAEAQKQVDAIQQAAKGNLGAYDKEQQNSINGLKERIKLLNQERNAMDMSSKEYAEATKELKVLNDKLREAGTSAGDWKANVGNYASSIKDAFADLGTAAGGLTGSLGGLNTGMLKLAANPLGATVMALVTAIRFLAEGIKSSEENTNRWNEVLVPLKTVLVMIQDAAQKAADKFLTFAENMQKSEKTGNVIKTVLQAIVSVFIVLKDTINGQIEAIKNIYGRLKDYVEKMKEWASGLRDTFEPILDFVDKVQSKIKDKLEPVINWIIDKYNTLAKSDLGRLFGLKTIDELKSTWERAGAATDKIVEDYNKTEESVRSLTKAQNELDNVLSGIIVKEAQVRKEIGAANREYNEALEAKDYQAAQEALIKKQEKELELAKLKKQEALANLNIAQQQIKVNKNSAEAANALAQAQAAVIDADAAIEEAAAKAAKETDTLNKKIEAKGKEDAAKRLKDAVEDLNIELNKFTQNYQSAISIEAPERPDIFTYGNTDSYYDQIKENAQIEYDAYATMTEQKIAKLQEWLDEQRAAGIEEKDLSSEVIELEKLKGEAAAGYPQQYKKMIDTQNKADKERAKTLKVLQKNELKGYVDLFDGISGLFEQDSIAYKATAVAKAIVSTYLAASESFANAGGAPWGFIPMAASIAAGLAQVKQILSVNAKGETSAPSAASSTPSVVEPVMVESQPFTYTRTAQTFEEEDALNQPLFVSVTDINNVQNRVRVTEEESSF